MHRDGNQVSKLDALVLLRVGQYYDIIVYCDIEVSR